jgi:hypothetical protein
MDDVELFGAAVHRAEHPHVKRQLILKSGSAPQGAGRHRFKHSSGSRIAAGEESHAMPEIDQRLGEVRDHAFGSTVPPWRDGFV